MFTPTRLSILSASVFTAGALLCSVTTAHAQPVDVLKQVASAVKVISAPLPPPIPAGIPSPAPASSGPLPVAPSSMPFGTIPNATPTGPAAAVDKVLQRIANNMVPSKNFVDPAAEAVINREMNVTRSAVQMLRPVGFLQIADKKMVYVLDDQQRILKIKEGSRIGMLQVVSISEMGVDYLVGGKAMFAPITFVQAEAPKALKDGAPITLK